MFWPSSPRGANRSSDIPSREIVIASREDPDAPIGPRARDVPVVPQTKDLGALLRELRESRQHLAVVVDEYGGTAGILRSKRR